MYKAEKLERLHEIQLEMLELIDKMCQSNGINYSMAFGSLIGTIRHKGFIPWDDDIDLMMPRKEYERFITIWKNNPPDGYLLQNMDTDSTYPNMFLKIRKKNTTFIQNERELDGSCLYNTGVFIDIFPFDNVAPQGKKRKFQYYCVLMNMLMSKQRMSQYGSHLDIFKKLLLLLPSKIKHCIRVVTERKIISWNKRKSDSLFSWSTYEYASKYFPEDMFDSFIRMPFETITVSVISKYDDVLRISYGDYMQLPPIEERRSHEAIVLNLDNEEAFENKT